MKQAYQFPAISHFCDLVAEEYGKDVGNTQEVLNRMSIHSATKMEHLLMMLHREQNHNMIGLATGEGWDTDEMRELHPDMLQVCTLMDAMMEDNFMYFQ